MPSMITISEILTLPKQPIIYPESDGKPIADNSIQFSYITTFKGGFDIMYADDSNIFIAGDMLWYPVEGHPEIRTAPDVMIALGRPKHDRGCYKQWEEGYAPPQVVFEIWSPKNTETEKDEKFNFYNHYGVKEFYAFDHDTGELEGWVRENKDLEPVLNMQNWRSPLLDVKFVLKDKSLKLYHPDDQPFLSYIELYQRWQDSEKKRQRKAEIWEIAEARQIAEEKTRQDAKARKVAEERSKQSEQQVRQAEELILQLQEQLKQAQTS